MKSQGVRLADVFEALQVYLGSLYINDFNRFGRTYKVTAQADAPHRMQAEAIGRLQVRNAAGAMLPLSSFVTVTPSSGPDRVIHYNGYPSADISGGALPGVSSGQAVALMERLAGEVLPEGMTFEWTDLTYQQKLAGNSALFIFPLCVLLAYLILAAQYNSWLLPLAVLLIVPMCLLSAIAGVWLVGGDNNVFVQIGLVVLVGLAAKNAILIVEFARTLEAEGARALEAVVEACRLRLRPILMTSLAFIAGVVPLVMASGAGANAPGHGRRGIRRDARGDAVRPVPHASVLRTGTGTGGAPGATRRRQPCASGGRPSMNPYLRSSLSALILLGGCAAVGPTMRRRARPHRPASARCRRVSMAVAWRSSGGAGSTSQPWSL